MTREQAIEQLKQLQESKDTEMAHVQADDVLCDLIVTLGYEDVISEYVKIHKWYA